MAKPNKPAPHHPQQGQALVHQQTTTIHSGPLPDPTTLSAYENLSHGAAERIIAMAEAEQKHRHLSEATANEAECRVRYVFQNTEQERIQGVFQSDRRGQYLGALVSLASLAGAAFTVHANGHWSVAIAFLSLPVMSTVKALRQPSDGKHPTDKASELK
jgi:uncharacterized membrane protein